MGFLDRFRRSRPSAEAPPNPFSDENVARLRRNLGRNRRRAFDMAEDDRLASRWKTTTTTADGTVRYSLAPLRARARELEENDPYIGRFFQLLESNVVGDSGILPIAEPPSKRNGKQIDAFAAGRIAAAFREWSKRGNVTVCGRYSFEDLEKRVLRSTAVDGEVFLIMVEGPQAGNGFDFAFEVIESDLLDESYSTELSNGNVVRMGVELNRFRRPIAYHFLTEAPGDYLYSSNSRRSVERRRIAAERVIHSALWARMRPGQTRAVTWLANVGPALYQLHAYRKAEAVAARIGSEKMGFYIPDGETGDWNGDHSDVKSDEFIQESEAGVWEIVPPGYKVETFDPDHPSTAFEGFNKAMMRSISAGLGTGYNAIASDLESVSFSSMRAGALEDRSFYRNLQKFIIETIGDAFYPRWLKGCLMSGAIKLDPADFERLSAVRWQTRGWQWVDPAKEGAGNQISTGLGAKLVGDIIAETSGRTLDEHLAALVAEREKFSAAGIRHPMDEPPPSSPPSSDEPDAAEPNAEEPDDDDDSNDDGEPPGDPNE